MGLWDKLKGRLGGQARAPAAGVTQSSPGEVEVRRHHYDFAHRALPQIAFGNVERFLFDLDHEPTRLLNGIWAFVGQKLTEAGEAPLDAVLAQVHRTTINGATAWIAALPPPIATTEAALIAFVRGKKGGTPDERLQYFTVEFGRGLQAAAAYYVLCRWNAAGEHLNSGELLEPDVEALTVALARHVAAQGPLN